MLSILVAVAIVIVSLPSVSADALGNLAAIFIAFTDVITPRHLSSSSKVFVYRVRHRCRPFFVAHHIGRCHRNPIVLFITMHLACCVLDVQGVQKPS